MRKLAALWILSLAVVGGAAAGVTAQNRFFALPQEQPGAPKILSGPDVGFRVTGVDRDGKVTGEWVETRVPMRARPATQ